MESATPERHPILRAALAAAFALTAAATARAADQQGAAVTGISGTVPAGAPADPAPAAGQLRAGDFVAVIGDSITEQKDYSVNIESYLLMCKPAADLRAMQFGWGGETAGGYKSRMANDTFRYKPTVATTCYGMNDGGYSPMNPDKARGYHDSQRAVVQGLKKAGVRFVVIGSPGCVDVNTYRGKNREQADMYNKTLADERDIARKVAQEEGVTFANVFDPMVDVMTRAEAKYGPGYHVAGGDGVHPAANGHLVMAYAFLRALGCNGEIGTISLNLDTGKAVASEGHKVLAADRGSVEIESTRYPFCFYGEPAAVNSTRGVLEFLPFNEDLNRFTLVVKNAGAAKVRVTWGAKSKEFDAAALDKGINLAAEFLDNPFSEPFKAVQTAVRAQQNFETPMIKDLVHNLAKYNEILPEDKDLVDKLAADLGKKDAKLQDDAIAAVKPVKHTIKLEAVR